MLAYARSAQDTDTCPPDPYRTHPPAHDPATQRAEACPTPPFPPTRPLLTDDFFAYLKNRSENEVAEEERGKIDALYQVTSEFVGFVDQTTRAMTSLVERLKKLLESKDKRAMILEMVDKDELDLNLMALLKTNINTARQGGQEDAALFMEKISAAAAKFVDGA